MVRIAYLILAHRSLELVYSQIDILASEGTKFYIHLDKKSKISPKPDYYQRTDVVFLRKRLRIHWGGFNMVRATVDLLKTASIEKFDFYILLSGQCFPIKNKTFINHFLLENSGKSFMQFIQLPSEKLIQGGLNKVNNFYPFDLLGILPDNHKKLIFRWFNNLLGIFRYKRKWPNNLVPYFGSQWWGLSREAVEYFLNYIESHKDIFLFFRYSWAPDELLIQTILGNSPLRRSIINRTFRYIDWTNTSTGSPKTLTLQDDYKKLLASEEIFARKFNLNFDSEIIEKLKECF